VDKKQTARAMELCVLNPQGDVWGPDYFENAKQAAAHLDAFWSGRKNWENAGFTLASAEVTVKATSDKKVPLP
jgi:hypothetical protein